MVNGKLQISVKKFDLACNQQRFRRKAALPHSSVLREIVIEASVLVLTQRMSRRR
jgi:CelD/BcsL family acetyltransferase involved in cellulose biosynthesis